MAFHFITMIIIIMPSVLRLILRASLKAEVLVAKVGGGRKTGVSVISKK